MYARLPERETKVVIRVHFVESDFKKNPTYTVAAKISIRSGETKIVIFISIDSYLYIQLPIAIGINIDIYIAIYIDI